MTRTVEGETGGRARRAGRRSKPLRRYWTTTAGVLGGGALLALLVPATADGKAAVAGCAAALWVGLVAHGVFSPRGALFLRPLYRATPRSGEPPGIALTFDDGPDPVFTPRILDCLRAAGARGTFFVVGRRAEEHPDLSRRIVAEGHAIGNHTYDHDRWTNFFSVDRLLADVVRAEDTIERVSGMRPTLFRPPVGLKNPRVAVVLDRLGLTAVTWRLSARDNGIRDPRETAERLLARMRPGDVVLFHDGARGADPADRAPTVQALAILLPRLNERGWRAVTVGELFDAGTRARLGRRDTPPGAQPPQRE